MTRTESDKQLVLAAHGFAALGDPALLRSLTYEMATQRLAALNLFYRPETEEFVTVE